MHSVAGACHCGNILVDLQLAKEPASYYPRACDCAFCRKHGACNTSDPAGHTRIVADAAALHRYRFGLGTADFLMCRRCGVYIGCIIDDAFASVNTRTLDYAFPQAPAAMDWSGEKTADERSAR